MRTRLVATLVAATLSSPAWALYQQTNLVSDLPGEAAHQDPNLINPWGVSYAPSSPFWVSDNMTGVATLYGADGTSVPLVVTVPPPTGAQPPSAPTGQVYNPTSGFGASLFLFATEDGTISGWNGGTNATLEVDNSAAGAVYKGLALAGTDLYATNFNAGRIDVFNSSFAPVTLAGGFTDPNLPAGYAPFNIQNVGGLLYVTYALQDASKANDVPGAGHGYLDVFNSSGILQKRLVSGGSLKFTVGAGVGARELRGFLECAPRRQLRRRHDPRVRSHDRSVAGHAPGRAGAYDPKHRPLVSHVRRRQRGERRDEHALFHGRHPGPRCERGPWALWVTHVRARALDCAAPYRGRGGSRRDTTQTGVSK